MLTSVSGGGGLARVRIDRLADAQAKGETITFTGGVYVAGDDAWREKAAVKTFVDCQPIY